MRIAYTDEQLKLRDELRAYFQTIVTPEVAAEMAQGEMGGPKCQEAVRQMGRDGWLGVGWPKEYGGRGFGPMEQFVFYDEAQRAGAPVPFLTINTVGPALMQFASDEVKNDILPRILQGKCFFSIGYSEPQAGTDLAGLKTRAVMDETGRKYVASKVPMKRMGTPEDVANVIAFLASDDAAYCTGAEVLINGGVMSSVGF